jgi:hypothetical protein
VPMIDVYAPAGVFDDKHQLARRLAAAVMLIEKCPTSPCFARNGGVHSRIAPRRNCQCRRRGRTMCGSRSYFNPINISTEW